MQLIMCINLSLALSSPSGPRRAARNRARHDYCNVHGNVHYNNHDVLVHYNNHDVLDCARARLRLAACWWLHTYMIMQTMHLISLPRSLSRSLSL